MAPTTYYEKKTNESINAIKYLEIGDIIGLSALR